jgi:hypothetical protein
MRTPFSFGYELSGYYLFVTQEYDEQFNCGHYHYYIQKDGHLLTTVNSVGAAHGRKLDDAWAKEELSDFIKRQERYAQWEKEREERWGTRPPRDILFKRKK